MIVKLLRYALLFLLPFIVYGIWLGIARRRARGHENEPNWRDAPFLWLSAAGLVLILFSLFALGFFQGVEKGGTYVPSRLINGELVPGGVQR